MFCFVQNQTSWWVGLTDVAGTIDNVTYDATTWVIAQDGYGYELISKFFDNDAGANWVHSCSVLGTPGSDCFEVCAAPTNAPTTGPSEHPTSDPIPNPTIDPSVQPTNNPTTDPTMNPTVSPTDPTINPTFDPSENPSAPPTMMCFAQTNCTQCTNQNSERVKWCLWNIVNDQCYFLNLSLEIDEDAIIDVDLCPNYLQSSDLTSGYQKLSAISSNIWIINAVIIGAFTTFNGFALIDTTMLRPNDYFQKAAMFKAMFGILDVISDVMFSLEMTTMFSENEVPLFIVITCWATIIIPVILSVAHLVQKSRGPWLKHDVTAQWMAKFPYILYISPFFCGSAFMAMAILNSNAFQLRVFSMSLPVAEKNKLNLQRVWTTLVLEVLCLSPLLINHNIHFLCVPRTSLKYQCKFGISSSSNFTRLCSSLPFFLRFLYL